MRRLGMALCAVGFGGCALYEGPDQPDACVPVVEGHQIAAMDVLRSSAQAVEDGMDVDGDGSVDNQLGSLQQSLISAAGIAADDEQARLDRRLAADFGWFVQLDVCPGGTTATFPGGFPLGMLMDFADVGTSPGFATTTAGRATISAGDADAIVAGALTGDYTHDAAVGIQPWVQLQRDAGNQVGDAFDVDHDGTVTVSEIEGTTLWQELMTPDLDLDGNGTNESLSFGFHVYFQ